MEKVNVVITKNGEVILALTEVGENELYGLYDAFPDCTFEVDWGGGD